MRKTKRLDLSRFFVLRWITVVALLLPSLTVNNAFASATPSIKKQLDLAVGQTVNFNFSMKKDEQIAISITGLSQETASGFSGNCGVFTSAGKSTYMSLSFRNDYVSTQVFGFNTGGNYFLNCTNLSTKEVAKIVISAVSFESITNPNNGNITIPGMESVLVSLKVKKDIPWFLTILGSGKTTASGFRGDCTVFDNSGKYTYLNLAFSNDFGSSIRSLPTYSGNVVLFCTNNSKEKAVLNFGMYSTASIRSETISTISIAPIDFAVLRFTTQKSQPISMSTKGNPKKTTSGFYGDCSIYDENGGFSYSSFNFDADRVIANVFTPSYSGFYYLQCYNRGTEAAIFEIFGLTELKQIAMTSDFLIAGEASTTTQASSSPKPSASSTSKPSPSPSLSGATGQGDVTTATNLTIEAQGSIKKIETGNFTFADIQRALDAANRAVEIANKALKAATSADSNSSKARTTAEDALDEAKKVQQLAKSLERANKSISNLNGAVDAITNTVNAMTTESACRDKSAKISAGLSIGGNAFSLLPLIGGKIGAVAGVASSVNDWVAIEKCKGK